MLSFYYENLSKATQVCTLYSPIVSITMLAYFLILNLWNLHKYSKTFTAKTKTKT
jgi:hypothetical protein